MVIINELKWVKAVQLMLEINILYIYQTKTEIIIKKNLNSNINKNNKKINTKAHSKILKNK